MSLEYGPSSQVMREELVEKMTDEQVHPPPPL